MTLAIWIPSAFALLCLGSTASLSQTIQLQELALHNTKEDCWIAIDDKIYDITKALADHQKYKYDLAPWCGRDASQAWKDKDGKGKPHSRKAQLMLKALLKGNLLRNS